MKYRQAIASDLSDVRKLLKVSFTPIYAYYAFKSFSTLKYSLVAIDSSELAGIINWRLLKLKKTKAGYLYWVAVSPEHRGKGLGTKLMRKAIKSIKTELGQVHIYVASEKDNRTAHKLIMKEGFTKIDKTKLKERFGKDLPLARREMMLMPWEDLFEL